MSEDEGIRQRRAELVEKRKQELDTVYDIHDSLLRELFHLQKFITLVGFNPHIAKQEKSDVWETFRKPFDLWDKYASGPSSRRTRRAITERRESLILGTGSSAQPPTSTRKTNPPDVERTLHGASLSSVYSNLSAISPLAPTRSTDNIASSKGKGKGKRFAHPITPVRASASSRKRPCPEAFADGGGKIYSSRGADTPFPDEDNPETNLTECVAALSVSGISAATTRRQQMKPKRRKSSPTRPSVFPETSVAPPQSPSQVSNPSPSNTPLPKRIRLIVKPPPPPPIATHPAQLPRPRVFGGSVPRLLSSFALLEENSDDEYVEQLQPKGQTITRPGEETPEKEKVVKVGMSWEEFERSVQDEVDIWRRIRNLRKHGGLGCMRGWEIVRGEEDDEQDEEESSEQEEHEEDENAKDQADGASRGKSAEDESSSTAVEPTVTMLKAHSSPRPMEEDVSPKTTDLDPNMPAEGALSNALGLDSASYAQHSTVNGAQHLATNGVDCDIVSSAAEGTSSLLDQSKQIPGSPKINPDPSVELDSVSCLCLESASFVDTPIVGASSIQPAPFDSSTHEPTPGQENMTVDPTSVEAPAEEPALVAPISARRASPELLAGCSGSNTPAKDSVLPTSIAPLPLPSHPSLLPSHYSALLATIPAHARFVKELPLTVRHRPAALIARYWERRHGAAERLIAAEERRIRVGAKALARGVMARAWKDAVAVIRARLKEQEEAEQAIEGRKHLAAILEQSSALLETQQEDLGFSKRPGGRSRSASSGVSSRASRRLLNEAEDEEQEDQMNDGEEGHIDGSDASGETDLEDGGEEPEDGSEMLVDLDSQAVSEDGLANEDEDVNVVGIREEADERDMDADEDEDEDENGEGEMDNTIAVGLRDDNISAAEENPGANWTGTRDELEVASNDVSPARSVVDSDAMSIVQDTLILTIQDDRSRANTPRPYVHPINGPPKLEANLSGAMDLNSTLVEDNFTAMTSGTTGLINLHPLPSIRVGTNGTTNPSCTKQETAVTRNNDSQFMNFPISGVTPNSTTSILPSEPLDLSPRVTTPSLVRKITLKLNVPELSVSGSPTPRRRSARNASVSTPIAGAGDSDSEVDGLAKDAEMPLEELMRRYGYIGVDQPRDYSLVGDLESETIDETISTRVVDSDDEDEDGGDEDVGAAETLLGPESVESVPEGAVRPPFLLRGTLRPYQQAGLEWLVSGYMRGINGILADEMGLGKTIQTISLLGHLACDRGIWGPHLIIVPTSVILNWEMEFKKFLPGFKVLSYYGSIKERKERRVGWNTEHSFNVVVTSYQLVLADQAIFRRRRWHYMILDEAHNIKNFKSQRWATLFSFNSERRLLLTGTPLQNNITELWSLLYFVQPDTANKQQFEEWFLETMRHAVETGNTMDEQTRDTVDKLHTVLRPYILRRMKADVERELPSKHEHIVYCRLSKRQRYLYDEFMSRAQTRETLAVGNFLSIVNCLMQLRKVCNHPDLFEVRPIVTSFTMPTGQSAVADYEIKELLVRRRLLRRYDDDEFSIWNHSFDIVSNATESLIAAERRAALNTSRPFSSLNIPGEPPPKDVRTISGNKLWLEYQRQVERHTRNQQLAYVNTCRNTRIPILGIETLTLARRFVNTLVPTDALEQHRPDPDANFSAARLIKSYVQREEAIGDVIDRFAFVTPTAVALDIPRLTLAPIAPRNISGFITLDPVIQAAFASSSFDILHRASVKLQIAFPESSLLQYDCGKLQELDALLREKHAGGHRVLIFTQMTRVLDILEIFLNFHGYRYLRLDGSTKIEQRQVVTERFNVDNRIFAFIASSRSGGVGINLTGADTVIFYDSDYNPSMDRQCEDRAHRIGQTREVNIYRFISRHTVEESMLRKANQKRLLDDIVIQQGEFDWRQVLVDDVRMERALAEVEDRVDVDAAKMAAGEEQRMDLNDFDAGGETPGAVEAGLPGEEDREEDEDDDDDGLRPIERYMLRVVEENWEFFC